MEAFIWQGCIQPVSCFHSIGLKFKTMWVGMLLYYFRIFAHWFPVAWYTILFKQFGCTSLSLSLSLKLRVLSEVDNWYQIACLWWEPQGLCMKIGTTNFFQLGFRSCHYWWTQSLDFGFHFLLSSIVFYVMAWGDNLLKELSWFGIISKEEEITYGKSEG